MYYKPLLGGASKLTIYLVFVINPFFIPFGNYSSVENIKGILLIWGVPLVGYNDSSFLALPPVFPPISSHAYIRVGMQVDTPPSYLGNHTQNGSHICMYLLYGGIQGTMCPRRKTVFTHFQATK